MHQRSNQRRRFVNARPKGRSSFSGNNRNSGGRRSKGSRIDISRFINKAVPAENIEDFIPKHQFNDFALEESLKKNITQKGYVNPTPIQDEAIPYILEGRDVVGMANTGTGKTGAFLIPLINKILKDRTQEILVMVPTRELALQIEEEFQGFAKGLRIEAVSCVGGANIHRQISKLRRRPNIILGTPGRLKDLIDRRAFDLSKFKSVVLDEADRMLDMGFIADMKLILSKMSEDRQTLFFSATLSKEIEKLVGGFLKKPVRVSVKDRETVAGVEQDVIRLGGKVKLDVLHDLLKKDEFQKVLVFGRTKHGVEKLCKDLVRLGMKAESIHGNKNQTQRQKALGLFKTDVINVLVATDVAARGIDVSDISHVINYDTPTCYEDYVHRIGRTGRAGKRGCALTFV